jgi:ribosome biogenesis protein
MSDEKKQDKKVLVRFEKGESVNDEFEVIETALEVPKRLTRYGLSEVVNHLLGRETDDKKIPFDFLCGDEFIRTSLASFMNSQNLSEESVLALTYVLAFATPELKDKFIHDDWIASVATLKANDRLSDTRAAVISASYDGHLRCLTLRNDDEGERDIENEDALDCIGLRKVSSLPLTGVVVGSAFVDASSCRGRRDDDVVTYRVLAGGKDGVVRLWNCHIAQVANDDDNDDGGRAFKQSARFVEVPKSRVLAGGALGALVAKPNSAATRFYTGSWEGHIGLWNDPSAEDSTGDARRVKRQRLGKHSAPGVDASRPSSKKPSKKGKKKMKRGQITMIDDSDSDDKDDGSESDDDDVDDGTSVRQPLAVLEGHSACVSTMRWKRATRMVSASWDKTVRLWDVESSVCAKVLHSNKAITALDESASSELLLTGHATGHIHLWDPRVHAAGGRLVQRTFKSHRGWVNAVAWHPKPSAHQKFISVSHDRTVKVWDTRTSIPLHTINGAHSAKVLCADFIDTSLFVSGAADNQLYFHSL